MAFDEGGFGSAFSLMNPQGNPLEFGSMLAHQPEGVIPQLAAEGITPAMFEQRFPELMGGGLGQAPGLSSGQLLNTGFAGGIPVLSGPESAVGPPALPQQGGTIQPTPVRTQSFLPPAGGAPGPAGTTSAVPAAAPKPAEVPPGYGDTIGPVGPTPEGGHLGTPAGQDANAKATAEMNKKIGELAKLLQGVKAPAAPQVQLPRPGTAGPPAVRPINPQSAISALLQQALGQTKAGPSLGGVIRR